MDTNCKKPNLFIIGAPKCGTTSIIHYLDKHPDIFVSPVKEPHYFNEGSGHRYYKNEADYLRLFSGATTQTYCCEGSVWYLFSENAVDNILRFNPDAKFVVMLRNPSTMFFSLHQELLFGGSENVKSAAKAWELQNERAIGKKIPPGASDPSHIQYGAACRLGEQAHRAVQKIPKENLHFVLLDDLIDNPDAAYRSLLRFLHVKQLSLASYEVVNVKKGTEVVSGITDLQCLYQNQKETRHQGWIRSGK